MKINPKTSIGALFCLGIGSALVAGGAMAQTPDPVAWRPDGLLIAKALSPLPQFIQLDPGRGPRGWRMNRDEDADQDQDRGGGSAAGRQGAQGAPGGMRPGMMALGGARFHMRKGDAEIDVRCPADVRMGDCVEAISKMIDRLGAMGTGAPR